MSEKVVRTLLVVWNFGAPNATPALPSPLPVCAPRGRAPPRAQGWGPVAIGHVFPRFKFWVHPRCMSRPTPFVHLWELSRLRQLVTYGVNTDACAIIKGCKSIQQSMDYPMNCSNLVIIPTTTKESAQRKAIQSKLINVCLFFFIGSHIDPASKHNIPCNPKFDVFNPSHPQYITGNTITLSLVDSYHNMGRKIVQMLLWSLQLNPRNILYLDMDVASRTSNLHLVQMFEELAIKGGAVGDILDCLTPANQVCCCGKEAQAHFVTFYSLRNPYQRAPFMLWGGGGIGLTGNALHRMVAVKPILHTTSDHTLSYWAHAAHIKLTQASWSHKHFEWCTSKAMDVYKIDSQTWQCPHSRHRNYTSQYLNCSL